MPLTPLARASALAAGLGAHIGLAAAAGLALAVLAAPTPASASCAPTNAGLVDLGTISIGNDAQRSVSTTLTVRCTASTGQGLPRFACFRFPAANTGDTASARVLRSGATAGPTFLIAATTAGAPYGTGATDYVNTALGNAANSTASIPATYVLAGGQAAGKAPGVYSVTQPVVIDVYFSLLTGDRCDVLQESSDSFTVPVRVTVATACNLGTIDRMDFGQAGSLSKSIDAQAAVRVTCTSGTPWTLSFGGGQNVSGSDRRMKNGTSYIAYRLFKDAGRAQAIAINGTATGSGNGSAQTLTVYGRVDAGPVPKVGTYVDSVVVTLSF